MDVNTKWRLYQLIWYVYPKRIINDYNQYASRGMEGQCYSRQGFGGYIRNKWRGYKLESED